MNKKSFTILFILIATVLNIVMTIVIIVALILLSMLVIRVLLKVQDPGIAMIAWMFCFLGGIILDMFVYSKVVNHIIIRFKLEDKLDPRLMGKRGAAMVAKEKENKPKTVLPKSVLGDEEPDTWGQEGYGNDSGYPGYTQEAIAPEDATFTPLNPEDFAGARRAEEDDGKTPGKEDSQQ